MSVLSHSPECPEWTGEQSPFEATGRKGRRCVPSSTAPSTRARPPCSWACPAPPQALCIPVRLRKLLGVMGGVAAPPGPVVGVSGFGRSPPPPRPAPWHCGVRTPGEGTGPQGQPLLKCCSAACWKAGGGEASEDPPATLQGSSLQLPVPPWGQQWGSAQEEECQGGLYSSETRRKSGVTESISCLRPFPAPAQGGGGAEELG